MRKQGTATVYWRNEAFGNSLCIKNGRIISPQDPFHETLADVAIAEGKIVAIGDIPSDFTPERTIDATGCWITPGFLDLRVNLREPGREDKETINTGTSAAAAGGFTGVACMPNTDPVTDTEQKVRYIVQRNEQTPSRVYPIGAATKELKGSELAPYAEMIKAGARAFSDGNHSIERSDILKNALNYAKMFNVPFFCNCHNKNLHKGVMNESPISTILGLRGSPVIAEDIDVARHIIIAEYTHSRIHIAPISSRGSVELIRAAKKRGALVTAATCPHYLMFTDSDLMSYNTNLKVNPPLRSSDDQAALIEALVDGTIDVICSDHAPHTPEDKSGEFDRASWGVSGLETTVSAIFTALVQTGIITPTRFVELLSCQPHAILGVTGGSIAPETCADITIIDPQKEWYVEPKAFFSKGHNSAYAQKKLTGQVVTTILEGQIVYERNAQ